MDPKTLIDVTVLPGVPAPHWFVQLFKVLGFALHEVPMNLWYAGVVVSMLLYLRGSDHGRRFAGRLMRQMPVIVALGVNLGIVPLLFVQVAYARVFYPATILMAWFWLGIIVLLIPAYYGVYAYAFGLRAGRPLTTVEQAAGWIAALFFVAIGFLFANGFSLMTNIAAWPKLWLEHSTGGAALGTASNLGDPTLWPRWLLMFGLALTTTAAWVLADAAWFAGRESAEYRRWAPGFALRLYTIGAVWFAVAGSWYVFGTWSADEQKAMFSGPLVVLTILTAVAPGLPWLLILRHTRQGADITRSAASLIGLAQFGVLGINAISRQVVQNLELGRYFAVTAQPVQVQWSPLVVFLLLFVVGLGVVAWMVVQAANASPEPSP